MHIPALPHCSVTHNIFFSDYKSTYILIIYNVPYKLYFAICSFFNHKIEIIEQNKQINKYYTCK